jgi:hypothetical protein
MNITYTIYNTTNGEIKRVVSTRLSPETQLSQDESYVLGTVPDESRMVEFYVKNSQFVERIPPPSLYHVWENEAWAETRSIEQIIESAARQARVKRNTLLASSDWTQLPDVPLETKEAWAVYRQALRDITSQSGFPTDIVWPTRPE